LAAESDFTEITELLIKNGADLTLPEKVINAQALKNNKSDMICFIFLTTSLEELLCTLLHEEALLKLLTS